MKAVDQAVENEAGHVGRGHAQGRPRPRCVILNITSTTFAGMHTHSTTRITASPTCGRLAVRGELFASNGARERKSTVRSRSTGIASHARHGMCSVLLLSASATRTEPNAKLSAAGGASRVGHKGSAPAQMRWVGAHPSAHSCAVRGWRWTAGRSTARTWRRLAHAPRGQHTCPAAGGIRAAGAGQDPRERTRDGALSG